MCIIKKRLYKDLRHFYNNINLFLIIWEVGGKKERRGEKGREEEKYRDWREENRRRRGREKEEERREEERDGGEEPLCVAQRPCACKAWSWELLPSGSKLVRGQSLQWQSWTTALETSLLFPFFSMTHTVSYIYTHIFLLLNFHVNYEQSTAQFCQF